MSDVPVHPVQVPKGYKQTQAVMPQVVTLRAYEVYKSVYAPQEALITGHCRGGFGLGELIALLYAYPFPRNEWKKRVDEAFTGMDIRP
jgi:hypothetical protein